MAAAVPLYDNKLITGRTNWTFLSWGWGSFGVPFPRPTRGCVDTTLAEINGGWNVAVTNTREHSPLRLISWFFYPHPPPVSLPLCFTWLVVRVRRFHPKTSLFTFTQLWLTIPLSHLSTPYTILNVVKEVYILQNLHHYIFTTNLPPPVLFFVQCK